MSYRGDCAANGDGWTMSEKIIRIGVFYDGNYLYHVSNYYVFHHRYRERLSISGLHDYIREALAQLENTRPEYCRIVDAHYFRGRYPTAISEQKGWIRGERIFEDVLMYNGVTTHFWPVVDGTEKSVEVALSLEAYEMTRLKNYDVCVLLAGDSDYTPLVQKIQAIGTRVMVLGWEFAFKNERGIRHETHVAKKLMSAAVYPVLMSDVIETDKYGPSAALSLFVSRAPEAYGEEGDNSYWSDQADDEIDENVVAPVDACNADDDAETMQPLDIDDSSVSGKIVLLNSSGWGFITPDCGEADIFFCYADLQNATFDKLRQGSRVRYEEGLNEKGAIARNIYVI